MLTENEIRSFITQDKASIPKSNAKISRKYYNGNHDIAAYRIFYYNAEGELVEDKTASNVRISHPFFSELADQQVQYMLSGNEIYETKDATLDNELKSYFNEHFKYELSKTLLDCIVDGFGYMYAYADAEGKIRFENAEAMNVIEVRAKDTQDNCDYIIYHYLERIEKNNKHIRKVQVWDDKKTWYFVQEEEGKLIKDLSEPINPRPHVIYKDGKDIFYRGLGFIPFFKIKNNKDMLSDLWKIKDLIDDYDMMACGLSNNLMDFTQSMYVVKGFTGDNLDELIHNLKTKKSIGVGEGGDVSIKTIDIPYQARQTKLELDEKNIYKFGMGFNSAQLGDGNITNVVIKSRYALLDLKCNKLEINLFNFLNKILKCILDDINIKNKTEYKTESVNFYLERKVITNEMDNAQIKQIEQTIQKTKVETLLSASESLDSETVTEEICKILDIDYNTVKNRLPESTEEYIKGLEDDTDATAQAIASQRARGNTQTPETQTGNV